MVGVGVGGHIGTDFLTVPEAGSPGSRCLAVSRPLPMVPGPTLRTLLHLDRLIKASSSKYSHIGGVRTSHRNLGGTFQVIALTLAPSMDSVFFHLIPPSTCPQPTPTEDHWTKLLTTK